jgi:hypothetical protein
VQFVTGLAPPAPAPAEACAKKPGAHLQPTCAVAAPVVAPKGHGAHAEATAPGEAAGAYVSAAQAAHCVSANCEHAAATAKPAAQGEQAAHCAAAPAAANDCPATQAAQLVAFAPAEA